MKIAVTGKGGVGKTTIAAVLARLYSREGANVLAIDADPDANLALALGFSETDLAHIQPLTSLSSLIEERTGARPGASGSFFQLNPQVDDIVDRLGLRLENIKFISLGKPKPGGSGCYCPENIFIRNLVTYHMLKENEVVIIDMEAGIEHLGRGTARAVDAFIIVVEPGRRSLQTAREIRSLASDLGITKVYVIANKLHHPQDEQFIQQSLEGFELIGLLPFDRALIDADADGGSPFPSCRKIIDGLEKAKEYLDNQIREKLCP